ncbi:MAG: aminoglycoside phosphotransferase family protein [Gemmatimonadota bacterium]
MVVSESEAAAAIEAFGLTMMSLQPQAGGHINASWRVATPGGDSYLLQRLNPRVFPDGEAVTRNVALVATHLWDLVDGQPDAERRVLRLRARADGSVAWVAGDGACWRVFHFIDRSRTCLRATTALQAQEVGRAFGQFQRMLQSYAGPPLVETIPGFHDTAGRLATLERTVAGDPAGRAASVAAEIGFAHSRADYAKVLPPLLAAGALPIRIVHNDAKAANVLLDAASGEALAVIDLDTVMPGTLLSDVGDLIRSIASPTDEDERDLARIGVRPPLLAALAAGFLGACGAGLTEAERTHFIFAGLLLTYEQGVRFLTDHLAGDSYYRTSRPGQNLDRARAQFRLLESLEAERSALEAMVDRTLHTRQG